jgi:hypothetical protein
MHFSWPQHLQAARTLELASEKDLGTALGLMGVAMLICAQDLVQLESKAPGRD